MSLPNTLLAFQDCMQVYEKALEDEAGVRVKLPGYEECARFRLRMNYARKLHRDQNGAVYPVEHPMHGRSPYDGLQIRIKRGGDDFFIYVEPINLNPGAIESLAGVEPAENITPFNIPRDEPVQPSQVEPIRRRI